MKKFLSMILAVLLVLGLFSSTTMAEQKEQYSEEVTFNICSEQVNESVNYNEDAVSRHFRDKFNFKWDIISLATENANEKIRIWINSGDMPDIVINNVYHHGEMMNYIDQGLVYRFPDNWKERWPNAAKAFELTKMGDAIAEQVGGTYIFPRPIYANNYPAEKLVIHILAYLRKDWCEAVGFPLKDAYTTDELMEYARLIKEKDPGQVGSRLIPIAAEPGRLGYMFTNANSTFSEVSYDFYMDENGQYQWGPATEDTLTGLKLYREAYDEELLHPEFYAYTGNQAQEDFYISGIAGMTILQGMASYMALTENYFMDNLGLAYDDVVHTATILGNDGLYHAPQAINYFGYFMFSPDIEEKTFNRFMDLIDYAAMDYAQLVIRMGIEDIDWNLDENGNLISHYAEKDSARNKYPSIYPIYHRLIVMSDDFTLINPAYKAKFRDRVAEMFILKNELSTDESIGAIDWKFKLHSSDAMSRVSINYPDEFAMIVLGSDDVETEWKNWVSSYDYLISPVLEELNAK